MINLTKNRAKLKQTANLCHKRGILIPTFAQMRNPETISNTIQKEISNIGLWDSHPRNLFRITWKNEPKPFGGGFGLVNHLVIPKQLSGVSSKIIALTGKWFPTGSHKVGASFGCLVPRLVTGQFDPVEHKAVWPSTGNYCRGGAYVSALLGCYSIAILPEGMSQERFQWLASVASEVIATPGCESNVKEIFDKCWELKRTRKDTIILNQFEELGNHLWHYAVTGPAMDETLKYESRNCAGVVLSSGSAGSLGAADYIKEHYPKTRIAVSEALQCPTLLQNGFGGHRIEGIGDKHIPWIHNVKNTDMVMAINDEHVMRLLRLFNEPLGHEFLRLQNIPDEFIQLLNLVGISGIANLISAIKFSHYYELSESDVVFTLFTDSMELYGSRVEELRQSHGEYTMSQAARDFEVLQGQTTDNMLELTYPERKRIHNLKYYTWVEQQGREMAELNAQWYDDTKYWHGFDRLSVQLDELIQDFNNQVESCS